MCATRQAVAVFGHGAENAEADAAHEARADDVAVTEAGSPEIDIDSCRRYQMCPGVWRGEERRKEIGQEDVRGGLWALRCRLRREMSWDENSFSGICGLLQKDC